MVMSSERYTPLSASALADACAAALGRLRASTPLVHCLTNHVASGFTAIVLLALGASPAMVDVVGEAGPFAGVASGVLVNLGTPSGDYPTAMREAVRAANSAATPWVLDPVAVGSLPVRTPLAVELAGLRPHIVRGNASEIIAVTGAGAGGRGVDAAASVDAATEAALALAQRIGGVAAVSGPVDLLTDGRSVIRVSGGSDLLTRVTGAGCALGAVMAAFAGTPGPGLVTASAATPDGEAVRVVAGIPGSALIAAVASSVAYAVASERAALRAAGPGTFAACFLDDLAGLRPADLADETRIVVAA